jgi:hypothetical protein
VIAPTDDQTKIIMEDVSRRLHAVPGLTAHIRELRSPYHSITFDDADGLTLGTSVKARTAGPTGRGLRGNKAHRIVLDEAAFIDDNIVDGVITPMLADYNGSLVKISTPCGRNHFWRDFQIGLARNDDSYQSFRFPTSDNPYIDPDFVEQQRLTKPDRIFRQEYLAEFIDEAGGVFSGVREAIRPVGEPLPPFSIGIDLAKHEDFTVVSVLDARRQQVEIQRFNRMPWNAQVSRISAIVSRYANSVIHVDSTGVGDPVFEHLRRIPNQRWHGYNLTNQSKDDLINSLVVQIESGKLGLLDDAVQTAELEAYQYEVTAARNVRMNAPSGMHDDTVIALALAAWPHRDRSGVSLEDWGSFFSISTKQ